mmetsp:Transcript_123448/g.394346  ORF Transcript_123448/g.394346 Transcript_123448/m.394346 type:complete len:202 (+) Transcript_123448:1487-2092(+)
MDDVQLGERVVPRRGLPAAMRGPEQVPGDTGRQGQRWQHEKKGGKKGRTEKTKIIASNLVSSKGRAVFLHLGIRTIICNQRSGYFGRNCDHEPMFMPKGTRARLPIARLSVGLGTASGFRFPCWRGHAQLFSTRPHMFGRPLAANLGQLCCSRCHNGITAVAAPNALVRAAASHFPGNKCRHARFVSNLHRCLRVAPRSSG